MVKRYDECYDFMDRPGHPLQTVSVSIIIPTLNEESCIGTAVRSLRDQGGAGDHRGGRRQRRWHAGGRRRRRGSGTVSAARPGAADECRRRSRRGETLLFIHADCTLEPGALDEAEQLLRQPRNAAGCFRMRVNTTGWSYRSIDWCATARVRLTSVAYGDQGLFLSRDRFERLGGFPDVPFMEDVLISRAL